MSTLYSRWPSWTINLLGVTAVAIVCTTGSPSAAARSDSSYDATIHRALALLPRRPAHVAVIDANDARPDTRRTLLTLDAFTISGSQVIYLVKQSAVLQMAMKGNTVMDYVLASIIWHEMAHAEGADEREAQRREEQLWTQFVRDERMDQVVALRYLSALHKRPSRP
jgi:hypothetical protein